MTRSKWYAGHNSNGSLTAFRCATKPTSASHGATFGAVVGPFRTMRGAKWAEKNGAFNPHFQHVRDAERIAAQAVRT